MKYIYLVLFSFSFVFSYSQDSIVISGKFHNNTRFVKVIIEKFGVGAFKIASIPLKSNEFSIKAPSNTQPGIYRFKYSEVENDFVDVIINGNENEIYFEIDANSETRKPKFIKSSENRNWYNYKESKSLLLQKINALQLFLSTFPDQADKLWISNNNSYLKLQQFFKKELQSFIDSNPGFWAVSMEENQPLFFPDIKKHWKIQDFEAREVFWNKVNTVDPKLQNSPLYTELILEYLKYYMNPEMKFTEQERIDGFIKSSDEIMEVFSKDGNAQKFALQFLQLGFKEMGQEKVLRHLDEKYVAIANQCQDGKNKQAFELRMAGYKAMQKGTTAPNIKWMTANGKEVSLNDLKTDKILLVFWASWCPHCLETMPKINEWAKVNQNVSVLAISLDIDFRDYQKKAFEFDQMFHYCDYKQWESEPVIEYYIYGTPTMILLDRDKMIESKFASEKELFEYFK